MKSDDSSHEKSPRLSASRPKAGDLSRPRVLIFTDLDGTLLDPVSYAWQDAEPALDLCRRLRIPIILVSSKTRAEMEVLRRELGLAFPFVSENGGGLFFPKEGGLRPPAGAESLKGLWRCSLGLPYDRLVRALRGIREELGWDIRGFSDMSLEEISRVTGLDALAAQRASQREYDEPCLVLEPGDFAEEAFRAAAARRGLVLTLGGRFYHLQARNDKGEAVGRLIDWYRQDGSRVLSVALGDSPNDFSMLDRVDYPVLIRSPKGHPGLEKRIAGLRRTREQGPKGWNRAVPDILDEIEKGGSIRHV